MPIVDRYEMSPEAKKIFREYWGDKERTKDDHQFLKNMRAAQAELIRVHFSEMDKDTKRRALDTLAWLEY